MSDADPLAAFWLADTPYRHALEELAALQFARDQALLGAHRAGLSPAELSALTGLSAGQVRHLVARGKAAEATGTDVARLSRRTPRS